jgi:hypothetical protein
MSYRFDIEHRTDGGARITCGDHEARDERALARKMVNAGAADGPIEAGRLGHVDYRVRSLHAFAATALEEGDRGFRVRTYKPHENSTVTPALERAVSRRECARKNGVSRSAGVAGAEGGVSQPLVALPAEAAE